MPTVKASPLRTRAPASGGSPRGSSTQERGSEQDSELPGQGGCSERHTPSAPRSDPSGHHRRALARALQGLDAVLLTRERIRETLEEAAERGWLARRDADQLVAELIRRGRRQTDEVLIRAEAVLARAHERPEPRESGLGQPWLKGGAYERRDAAVRHAPHCEHLERPHKAGRADRGRDEAIPCPISNYAELTVAQVSARLDELTAAQLRQMREYERRHANRKSLLERIERQLEGR